MEETHEVKIRVNEYVSITMNIPKELDASEFHSLLSLTKQVSNLKMSDSEKNPAFAKSHKAVPWSEEEDKLVMEEWKKFKGAKSKLSEILSERIGRSPGAIQARYYDTLKARMDEEESQ